MNSPQIADLDAMMRLDLLSFLERSFSQLHEGQELSIAPYLERMTATLQRSLLGQGSKRLIINIPPRTLKSVTVSVAAVAWLLGHDPSKQIICASYGQDLADKHSRDCRRLISSPFYKRMFPKMRLSADKNSVSDFTTTMNGGRRSTSVGGVLTGLGANVIIIDDPLKPDDAISEPRRSAVNEWYDSTLRSRLNNKEEGIIIIVMQRLHQDDLVGHVLDRGESWEVLSFPAIAEEDEYSTYESCFGPRVYTRMKGEVLDATRESLQSLETTKKSIGSYDFASQYQQDPEPAGGIIVQKSWLTSYSPEGSLPRYTIVLQSWDTANKSGELNDFSVCTTWGYYDGKYYLLHVYRARLNYPELKRKVIELDAKFRPNTIIIEDHGSGTQLFQDLKSDLGAKVKPYKPATIMDKTMRLHAQTAKFENGDVLLPESAPWLEDYVKELTSFPGCKYDDQVDSTTQALDFLSQNGLDTWIRLGRRMSGV